MFKGRDAGPTASDAFRIAPFAAEHHHTLGSAHRDLPSVFTDPITRTSRVQVMGAPLNADVAYAYAGLAIYVLYVTDRSFHVLPSVEIWPMGCQRTS